MQKYEKVLVTLYKNKQSVILNVVKNLDAYSCMYTDFSRCSG